MFAIVIYSNADQNMSTTTVCDALALVGISVVWGATNARMKQAVDEQQTAKGALVYTPEFTLYCR
jgi:hypothetical protein